MRGVATLELTITEMPVPVLRMHFVQGGRHYEATFQWIIDLDNYARFTGYVYRPDGITREADLEMIFLHLPPMAAAVQAEQRRIAQAFHDTVS